MKTLIFALLSTILLSSCSDNIVNNNKGLYSIDTSSFSYPFTTGTTWSYKRKFSAENIRPDSIRHYFANYPFYARGSITVLYDTLINGITTKVFLEEYIEVQGGDTLICKNRYYYKNYDTALVCYAHRYGWGGSLMPFSVNKKIKFQKLGKTFDNIFEINNFAASGISASNDSLYLENPPAVTLKYPILRGTEWVAKYIQGTPWFIKKYVSFENVFIGSTQVNCIKTERKIQALPDIEYYDYYSKFGQLKKDFTVKDMIVTNQLGYEIGRADLRDLYEVVTFNIISP